MAQTTTAADAALQNHYLPVVREQINQRAFLLFGYSPDELEAGMGKANAINGETVNYNGIVRDADKFEFAGRNWYFASHISRNESGTAASEDGNIALPGKQGFEDFYDSVKHFYKQFEITGFAMEVSERNVASYVKLLEAETEGTINDARHSLNREGYGDGSGVLATETADGANTITVDTVQYLRVGMYIDVIDTDGVTVNATNRKITAINQSTLVVTYDGADASGTTAAGDYIVLTGNNDKELTGLKAILDPAGGGDSTLHNVDGSAAGNEYWKAKVYDGGSAAFDEDQGQQLLDAIGAEGYETEVIVTTRGIRRRYVNQLKAAKRFNDTQSVVLHGGFKAVMFNEQPMLFDDQCPKGYMWFLRPSDFGWMWLGANDFRWLRRDGKILRMTTGVGSNGEDKDNWRATLYRFHDLACFRRKTQGVIHTLADDTAGVSS
jgi:hypothetical protein